MLQDVIGLLHDEPGWRPVLERGTDLAWFNRTLSNLALLLPETPTLAVGYLDEAGVGELHLFTKQVVVSVEVTVAGEETTARASAHARGGLAELEVDAPKGFFERQGFRHDWPGDARVCLIYKDGRVIEVHPNPDTYRRRERLVAELPRFRDELEA